MTGPFSFSVMHKYVLLLALLAGPLLAWAQPQAYNWQFGNRASITFPGGGNPVLNPLTNEFAREGCASISDDAGVLQCYTNGTQVWDRTNTPMPNGALSGSSISASQATLLLRAPDQPALYYLFTVDAQENNFVGGLRYMLINMALRGGLGDGQPSRSVPVPGNQTVGEKLTAVRHANGRDYWVLVHSATLNRFYAYLLSPAGLSTTPVVSTAGVNYTFSDAIGYLRASPSGQLLAAGELDSGIEVFDFDKNTGNVTLRRTLSRVLPTYHYCVEFSPDNSKLYASNGTFLFQFDLSNNYAMTNLGGSTVQGIQRAPNGQIYVSQFNTGSLSVVQTPNAAGTACNFRLNFFPLGGAVCAFGLPNFPNDFASLLTFSAPGLVCANTRLTVSANQAVSTTTYSWSFGDNTAAVTGATASHVYTQPGTYTITLTATPQGGTASSVQQTVVVNPSPVPGLGPRRRLACGSQTLVLAPAAQPAGTTYRWQDGSTAPTYTVRQPGNYVLTLSTPAGCTTQDTVTVEYAPTPQLRLEAPTVLCDAERPVVLRASEQPAGTTYRWQDGSTAPTYVARQPGRYVLEVRSAAGCTTRDSVTVRGPLTPSECAPVLIPNIVLPAGRAANATFQLQGLQASDFQLTIYNRWGREVYRRERYDNSWAGTDEPAGLYYYLLVNPATNQRLRGWVEVMK